MAFVTTLPFLIDCSRSLKPNTATYLRNCLHNPGLTRTARRLSWLQTRQLLPELRMVSAKCAVSRIHHNTVPMSATG